MTVRALHARSPLAWAIDQVRLVTPAGLEPFVPYAYQAALLADREPRAIVLKARQVGISQSAAVLIAHEALFKSNATVLLVSRDQGAAGHLLAMVYAIFDELDDPPVYAKRGTFECELANGSRIISQPATAKAARGLTATLVVLDEFAFCDYDDGIYRAVQPTLSRGGRLLVISTPNGQSNLFYRLWHGLEPGKWNKHRVHWRDCPSFGDEWYARERVKYSAADWAQEYDLDFVASGGSAFDPDDVAAMVEGWVGLTRALPDRRYVSGWDIGRRRDATVGVTLDVTELPWQLVAYERLQRAPFAQIQAAIDRRAGEYGPENWIEVNGIGDPVFEALACVRQAFTTTAATKAAALMKLVRAVENGEVKAGVPQLLSELKSYQWDDSKIVQDSVMALAIAIAGGTKQRRIWTAA